MQPDRTFNASVSRNVASVASKALQATGLPQVMPMILQQIHQTPTISIHLMHNLHPYICCPVFLDLILSHLDTFKTDQLHFQAPHHLALPHNGLGLPPHPEHHSLDPLHHGHDPLHHGPIHHGPEHLVHGPEAFHGPTGPHHGPVDHHDPPHHPEPILTHHHLKVIFFPCHYKQSNEELCNSLNYQEYRPYQYDISKIPECAFTNQVQIHHKKLFSALVLPFVLFFCVPGLLQPHLLSSG